MDGWRGDVIAALESLYPLHLAEGWDNVGLLVDCLDDDEEEEEEEEAGGGQKKKKVVLITNDLTERTLDEALAAGATLVVTYHPRPFGKFKRLVRDDVTQRIVLRCVRAGVAVWSPHTACDNAAGGVNDWLASGLADGGSASIRPVKGIGDRARGLEGVGNGRIFELATPISVGELLAKVKAHLKLPHLRVAPAASLFPGGGVAGGLEDALAAAATVRTVAVQAGSGHSVLAGCAADAWVTGEASHHEVLAANAEGATVILAEHSNTERGFLPTMREALLSAEGVAGKGVTVIVSASDEDPLRVV